MGAFRKERQGSVIASEFSQRDDAKHSLGTNNENCRACVDCTMCYNMMRSMVDIAHTGVGSKTFLGLD